MKVKRRLKKNCSRTHEYFLHAKNSDGGLIYNEWMTIAEMVAIKECSISAQSLRDRIFRAGARRGHDTLWSAICAPLRVHVKRGRKPRRDDNGFCEFLGVMNLMKVRH